MSNILLTIDMITREALRVLHQKLNLVGNLNRQYDKSFAVSGAKIGNTLRVRKPPKYAVQTGSTLTSQDATETYTTLTVNTQSHVALTFTSNELTMSIDDFSSRFIDPAMAAMAAHIEGTVATGLCKVAQNSVTLPTTDVDFADLQEARERLTYALAPQDNNRVAVMAPSHVSDLLNDTKGLFQESSQIAKQYREGLLGRIAGFEMYENTLVPSHTTGANFAGTILSNGTDQTGATINIDGLTSGPGATLVAGDIITFAGSYAVHPETKATLGHLKQFVVTALSSGVSAESMPVTLAPAVVASGATQNVSQAIADGSVVALLGASGSTYQQSLLFHKDFACFATADLLMPQGVDMASRQVMDGISMRIVRDYAISSDSFPCRCDVLWGYKELYPELGCTIRF